VNDAYKPATPEKVFVGVENALRRQFGSPAEIAQVGSTEKSAVFGFTVDGVGYSLTVNVTE